MKAYDKPSVTDQLYRDFRDKIQRRFFKKFEMPWMKSKELDVITEVIINVQPEHCFEWGSGFSTLLLPGLLPGMKSWHSVEHHKAWFEFVARENQDPRVSISLINPDNPAYITFSEKYNPKMEGSDDDFKTYIEFPETLHKKFDFVFIDGRARKACLKKAYDLLSEKGVVIVHDANRDDYFSDLPAFASTFRLTDYRKHRKLGGIWVGTKSFDINTVLDTDHHVAIWKRHDVIARSLFLR